MPSSARDLAHTNAAINMSIPRAYLSSNVEVMKDLHRSLAEHPMMLSLRRDTVCDVAGRVAELPGISPLVWLVRDSSRRSVPNATTWRRSWDAICHYLHSFLNYKPSRRTSPLHTATDAYRTPSSYSVTPPRHAYR